MILGSIGVLLDAGRILDQHAAPPVPVLAAVGVPGRLHDVIGFLAENPGVDVLGGDFGPEGDRVRPAQGAFVAQSGQVPRLVCALIEDRLVPADDQVPGGRRGADFVRRPVAVPPEVLAVVASYVQGGVAGWADSVRRG